MASSWMRTVFSRSTTSSSLCRAIVTRPATCTTGMSVYGMALWKPSGRCRHAVARIDFAALTRIDRLGALPPDPRHIYEKEEDRTVRSEDCRTVFARERPCILFLKH